MKTIIKITKQEAIDAFKKQQGWSNDKEIIIEIEDNHICPTFIGGNMPLISCCPLCGKYGQHVCVTC